MWRYQVWAVYLSHLELGIGRYQILKDTDQYQVKKT